MRKFLIWFGIGVGIIVIFITVFYLVVSALFNTEPYVASDSYLSCNIWGDVPEYAVTDALEEYLSGTIVDLVKIRRSFRMAAHDDRINGIVLRIGLVQTGFAKLQELHQLIREFRSSGKKVLAFLDIATTRDYYLASACDSIYLQPGGSILLTGLAAEVTFYKGLLDKIGVEADFEHVGKYKSYPEPYTRQKMSDPMREVIDDILDRRYADIVKTIAANRGIPADSVEYIINSVTGITGSEAVRYGLIDGELYRDDVADRLTYDDRELSEISVVRYAEISPREVGLETGERIALIYCSGSITGGEDGEDPVFGLTTGAGRMVRNLESAAQNKRIKAIILRIDSPGGSGIASEKIWKSVKAAAQKKPVIASISDLGASGGYYIAIGADSIIAQPASLIGSIGVFIGKFSLGGLYGKLGIDVEAVQKGRNARMFSLLKTFSDSERAVVRKLIEDAYEDFVYRVAENRNQSYEQIDAIAQGRVWTGDEGHRLGLIDTLGGLQDAVNLAKMSANLDIDEPVQLVIYPRHKSILSSFSRYLRVRTRSPLQQLEEWEAYFRVIQLHKLALMPFQLKFY